LGQLESSEDAFCQRLAVRAGDLNTEAESCKAKTVNPAHLPIKCPAAAKTKKAGGPCEPPAVVHNQMFS
jgi:hypothetical protein